MSDDAASRSFRWSELLDAVTAGHDKLDPHPGGPALATLDVPRILSWEPGKLLADWDVPERLTNLRGELFGGYFGVLADVALSFTVMTVVEESERFKTNDGTTAGNEIRRLSSASEVPMLQWTYVAVTTT